MKYLLIGACMVSVMLSCNNVKHPIEVIKQESPKVLTKDNSEISSFSVGSRNHDMVNDLYEGVVDENKDFKNLEKQLGKNKDINDELCQSVKNFDQKNIMFYNSANEHVSAISDTLLKSRLVSLLLKSASQYKNKSSELESLVKTIGRKEEAVQDYHTALMIITSLALIEKFQNDQMPGKANYKSFIKQQDSTLMVINKLMNKKY